MKIAHWTLFNQSGMFRVAESFAVAASKTAQIQYVLMSMSTRSAQQILNDVRVAPGGTALNVVESLQQALYSVHDPAKHALNVNIIEGPLLDDVAALKNLRIKYVRFEQVGSLTGALAPPAGATIELDQWPEGVDALPSGLDGYGRPTKERVVTGGGATIAAILTLNGSYGDYRNYSLSGTPASGWPCALIYAVSVPLISFNKDDALEPEFEILAGSGAPGSVWRDGDGPPADSLGIDGDYYLDGLTGDVYLRASGAYSVAANIRGPQGEPGIVAVGAESGDVLRWNSVTQAWEARSEPLEFKQIVLTPAETAALNKEGALWYKSTDKTLMVCTDDTE